jgi:hypothetical protein
MDLVPVRTKHRGYGMNLVPVRTNPDTYRRLPTDGRLRNNLHKLLLTKMRAAGWQSSGKHIVETVKRAYLQKYCGVYSSTELNTEQLTQAIETLRVIAINKPTHWDHKPLTVAQRNCIIRLGKYVIGKQYGDDWFWQFLPKAIHEMYQGVIDTETGVDMSRRCVTRIHDLTEFEADYIIKRLMKIEERMHQMKATSR